jgi:RNA polymerase sigma factor (sigma-70 family)
MRRLNPRTREIFLAKRLDGMSYSEIARRTGLSVRRVERHITKALVAIDRELHR